VGLMDTKVLLGRGLGADSEGDGEERWWFLVFDCLMFLWFNLANGFSHGVRR
jgi:hypothetical protein